MTLLVQDFRNRQEMRRSGVPFRNGKQIVGAIFVATFPSVSSTLGLRVSQGRIKNEEGNASRPRYAEVTAKLGIREPE
jgi:formylmethanofuran dehydrogenase subunit B